MNFFFPLALLVAFGSHANAALRSFISTPKILTSVSPDLVIYSCFVTNEFGLDVGKDSCCRGAIDVWQQEKMWNDRWGTLSPIELHQRCELEIAQVPSSIASETENRKDIAQFSWVVPRPSLDSPKQASVEQHLWKIPAGGVEFERHPVRTTTPYQKTSIESTPIMASKIDSHLGQDGGMHRLFHHRYELLGNTDEDSTYFLYLIIPSGMFIDLDDPIEATTGTLQSISTNEDNGAVASDTNHGFVATATSETSSVKSFRARLHAATVCDIEQPSFVSGQHLLVWEIDQLVTTGEPNVVMEFATKLHLRYPHPTADLEEWIDLPSPLLFAASNQTHHQQKHDWDLKLEERVWVAAGRDDDHDWIMGMTISFCLIGVGIMLRDVSRVSLWDDV
eukprot:CAMPEP_0116142468 /NCGR_PEP_ID=MMETSP0329-20121206/14926_1 /TAXON_ID=697910 /ORGANISM="Pseudo-nitzschia arenysensis, Strain B593" /LENGTH=391 /DNA_ID=CAMNT_0003637709 /DNA_START=84 /DNA_END=1259 /DNA_ORIENTATION=+